MIWIGVIDVIQYPVWNDEGYHFTKTTLIEMHVAALALENYIREQMAKQRGLERSVGRLRLLKTT